MIVFHRIASTDSRTERRVSYTTHAILLYRRSVSRTSRSPPRAMPLGSAGAPRRAPALIINTLTSHVYIYQRPPTNCTLLETTQATGSIEARTGTGCPSSERKQRYGISRDIMTRPSEILRLKLTYNRTKCTVRKYFVVICYV